MTTNEASDNQRGKREREGDNQIKRSVQHWAGRNLRYGVVSLELADQEAHLQSGGPAWAHFLVRVVDLVSERCGPANVQVGISVQCHPRKHM